MEPIRNYHPSPGTSPLHVGIIPDGGRRWSSAYGCSLEDAYVRSKKNMKTLVTHLLKNGVKEISIYLSSIQNFRRPPNEIEANLRIVESALEKEIEDVATNHGLVVTISGNREVIPSFLADKFNSIEEKTHDNLGGRLNLLVAYDPVEEVAEAFKKADAPENFIKHLTVKTPLDLIIRSGGVPLTSNFLPLQAAYARLYFLDKLFNEVTTADLDEILRQFGVAYRKFGE